MSDDARARRDHRRRLRRLRILIQALAVLAFLVLFRLTEYRGADEVPRILPLVFRLDPFLALAASLAGRTLLTLFWPALVLVVVTTLAGRVFCGWLCPMGTLLDGASHVLRAPRPGPAAGGQRAKYLILVALLVAAAAGLPLAGVADPLAIVVRGLTFSVDPAANAVVRLPLGALTRHAPPAVADAVAPLSRALTGTLLPGATTTFRLALVSGALLVAIILLELLGRRFWCRVLCPLGALLSLLSRRAPLRWRRACPPDGTRGPGPGCRVCAAVCPTAAVDPEAGLRPGECILCLDCMVGCPAEATPIGVTSPGQPTSSSSSSSSSPSPPLSRRALLGGAAAGLAVPVLGLASPDRRPPLDLIRPPGALPEPDFLARCVRCGECMKVCVGNALQPSLLDGGLASLYTPRLEARTGYCEYNCTLCGQVCPSGALAPLELAAKHRCALGTATVDRSRCLPWARGIPCLVCEEHCPVSEKAIVLRPVEGADDSGRTVQVQAPVVVVERCVGCGACEHTCPLPGPAAITVSRAGESRSTDPDERFLYRKKLNRPETPASRPTPSDPYASP